MSETKWTKGPWTFFEHSWAHTGIFSSGKRVAALELSEVTEETEEALGDEMAANAHLIAAAPDLYEALEAMVEWYGKRNHTDNHLLPMDSQEHEIADAMMALAKARGENNG